VVKLPLDSNENLPEESESRIEAAVGTLVHRALELIARDGLEAWPIKRVTNLQPAYQRWLQQQGQPLAEAVNGARQVVAALCVTLNSSSGRWVLGQQKDAAAEEGWSSKGEFITVNHVIDRVFVTAGQRWIIDYKTVQQPANAPADFLLQRAESYRPQLARYASLFAHTGLPLRLAIFYPVQGILIELN
jgi:ATP-dependent exoDNAse (exonuclease V) beta subunit